MTLDPLSLSVLPMSLSLCQCQNFVNHEPGPPTVVLVVVPGPAVTEFMIDTKRGGCCDMVPDSHKIVSIPGYVIPWYPADVPGYASLLLPVLAGREHET